MNSLQYLPITCGTKRTSLTRWIMPIILWPLLVSLASPQAPLTHLAPNFAPDVPAFSLFLEQNFPTPELSHVCSFCLKSYYSLYSTCLEFSLMSLYEKDFSDCPFQSCPPTASLPLLQCDSPLFFFPT